MGGDKMRKCCFCGAGNLPLGFTSCVDAMVCRSRLAVKMGEMQRRHNLEVEKLKATLDHHGNCQEHRLNNPCEVALARKSLQEYEK
jgi:hypothetical protein